MGYKVKNTKNGWIVTKGLSSKNKYFKPLKTKNKAEMIARLMEEKGEKALAPPPEPKVPTRKKDQTHEQRVEELLELIAQNTDRSPSLIGRMFSFFV
jgi:predicted Zn-dependent protease